MPNPSAAIATRRRQGGATRERVVLAATALFAARGFAPVTMRAIGEAAGLDNSSLYRHFASKSDLARQVLDRAMADLSACVLAAASPESESAELEGLVELGTSAALHLWDHPDTARLMLHWIGSARDAATGFDVSLPADAIGFPSGELFRAIATRIEAARESGRIREIAWPESLVAVVGVIALRPASYRSFLASQEPVRSAAAARSDWEREVRHLLRASLAP